jgi:hypothetical protein
LATQPRHLRYASRVRTDATHTPGRFQIGSAGVCGVPLLFVACTQMLGIDGEYVGDEIGRTSSGGAGVFREDAQSIPPVVGGGGAIFGGFGGSPSGGAPVGNGGIPIGVSTGGNGGNVAPPVDSGTSCTSCPPVVAACPSGTFAGTVSGDHSASILAGFRIPIEGTVTFSVAQDPANPIASVSGMIEGSATIAPNSFANFTATLIGSMNCADASMKGTISGTYGVAAATRPIPFEGTHQGVFVNAAFEGSWSEHETVNPSMSQYFGTGTWIATSAGP